MFHEIFMVKSANYRDWIFNFGQNEGGKDISFSINSHQFTFSSDWLLVLNFLVFETSNSGTTTAREIAHLDFIDPRTTIEVNCSHPKTWKRSSHNRHFFQQMARVNFLCVSTSRWSNTQKKNHELSFFLSNLIKAKFTFFPTPKNLIGLKKNLSFCKNVLESWFLNNIFEHGTSKSPDFLAASFISTHDFSALLHCRTTLLFS